MNRNKFIFFLEKYYYIFLPLFTSIVTVVFLHPWYDLAGDDLALANIVHSAQYNSGSEYLVFISVILGKIMRFAALAFPKLNIYGITLLMALTLAFSVLFYNIKKYENKIISILLISILQIYMIFGITFTVVAFVCCAAAVLVIVDNVPKLNKKAVKFIIVSLVLFFFGLGFRRNHLVVGACLVLAPVCLFAVMQKRITIPVLIVIVTLFAGTNMFLKTTQNIYVQNLFAGTDYIEFNRYRAAGTDSGGLYYDKHKEYFDANGISENDVNLFKKFHYSDKTIFPTEKAKIIAESFSFSDKYILNPIYLLSAVLKKPFVLIFLILSIILFIARRKERKEIFSYVFVVLGAILYLYFRKRGVERVVKPIVFIGIILLLHTFLRAKIEFFSVRQKTILQKVVLILAVVLFVGVSVYRLPDQKVTDQDEVIEYIQNDKYYNYVPVNGIYLENNLSFIRSPQAPAENIMFSIYRGWTVYSPYWYSLLEHYDLEEYKDCIYLSLIDSKVKIVCKSDGEADMLAKALQEHYDKKVLIKKEKEYKNCFICTLVEDTENIRD